MNILICLGYDPGYCRPMKFIQPEPAKSRNPERDWQCPDFMGRADVLDCADMSALSKRRHVAALKNLTDGWVWRFRLRSGFRKKAAIYRKHLKAQEKATFKEAACRCDPNGHSCC